MLSSYDSMNYIPKEIQEAYTILGISEEDYLMSNTSPPYFQNLLLLLKNKVRVDTCRTRPTMPQGASQHQRAYWITINPDLTHQNPHTLIQNNKLFLNRYCTQYSFNIEQRSKTTDNMGKGVHTHIICNPKSTKNFKRDIRNNYRHMVGNEKSIKISAIPQDWYKDKVEYIKGHKWDTEKESQIAIDNIWRKGLRLKVYYD